MSATAIQKRPLGKNIGRTVREWVMITLGVLIYAFSYVNIILGAKAMGGGASGMALLIHYATGGPDGGGLALGTGLFIINAVFLVAAIFILGAKFGIKTIYSLIMLSVSMNLMQEYLPADMLGLADNRIVSAIFGGFCTGFGAALIILQGGSLGGTDIIALIIRKFRNISYGTIILVVDVITIGCSWFIFHDILTVVYGYLLTLVFSLTADTMLYHSKKLRRRIRLQIKWSMRRRRIKHTVRTA